jgi:hypothetical protein
MKDIKDYLHLYMKSWCTISNCSPDMIDDRYEDGAWVLSARLIHYAILKECRITLHLRPLSSMTEEEVKVLIKYDKMIRNYHTVDYCRDFGPGDVLTGITIYYRESHDVRVKTLKLNFSSMNADDFRYLLSKGFDLFELIPSNLAIDATKIERH